MGQEDQGLEHGQIAHSLVNVYSEDIARLAVLFSERCESVEKGISFDAFLGTLVELVDEALITGHSLGENADPTPIVGGLAHFTFGYVCGLTDRDSEIGMEGV